MGRTESDGNDGMSDGLDMMGRIGGGGVRNSLNELIDKIQN
jgi:hypothetical protein